MTTAGAPLSVVMHGEVGEMEDVESSATGQPGRPAPPHPYAWSTPRVSAVTIAPRAFGPRSPIAIGTCSESPVFTCHRLVDDESACPRSMRPAPRSPATSGVLYPSM